jgi:hypothetical protein
MKNIILMFVTDSRFDFIKITLTVYVIMKNCVANDANRTLSSVRKFTSRRRLATLNKSPGLIFFPPKIHELTQTDVFRIRGKEQVSFQIY